MVSLQVMAQKNSRVIKGLPASVSFENAHKGTGDGDTITRSNLSSSDTLRFYYLDYDNMIDSGYVTGYNVLGHKSYAELYRINNAGTQDSTVSVLGMYAYLAGTANATSTKTVTLTAWSQAARTQPDPTGRPNLYLSGRPDAIIATATPMTLGSISVGGNIDTLLYQDFATPSAFSGGNFFVGIQLPGYDYSNLGGDSVGLIHTKYGNRRSLGYTSGSDTTYLLQNLAQEPTGNWVDFYLEHPDRAYFHLVAMPVIKISIPSAINGVTKKDLTVFGTFPNPAVNATTLKVAFANNTAAQIGLYDMTGRKVREVYNGQIAAGEHELAISTEALAAGNYVILVRTADGEGMGLQMTVAK